MGKTDKFGNRMGGYESQFTEDRLISDLPVVARIKVKCPKRFRERNSHIADTKIAFAMLKATECLIKETNALIGYTQSNEIVLVWDNWYNQPMLFGGKVNKLLTFLAAGASVAFNAVLNNEDTSDGLAVFDCKVYNVPDKEEACNILLWREKDAVRNTIFTLARSYYPHSYLQKKGSNELLEMISAAGGTYDHLSEHQKRGTYIRKETVERKYTTKELHDLPEKHAVRSIPDLTMYRREIEYIDMPPFGKVLNKVDVIFGGLHPVTSEMVEAETTKAWECSGENCNCG